MIVALAQLNRSRFLVGEADQDALCKHTMLLLLLKCDRRTVSSFGLAIVEANEWRPAMALNLRSIRSAEACGTGSRFGK
jgi:hypothetical protein